MTERIGAVAGSFDPITKGHLWLIAKAVELTDEIIIAVGNNPQKKYLFTFEERRDLIYSSIKDQGIDINKVRVLQIPDKEFLVNCLSKEGVVFLIKGIRDTNDFIDEQKQLYVNKMIQKDIETIFIITPKELSEVSSSMIKATFGLNGSVIIHNKYITISVYDALKERLK